MKQPRRKSADIPGSSRKERLSQQGEFLQYRNVYLRPIAWELLASLSRGQGISGSEVIERLIENAVGYRIARPRQY